MAMESNESGVSAFQGIKRQKVKTYTKKDVAKRVARSRSRKLADADKWVDQVFVALREIMMEARPELRIEIRDFGVFEIKRTKSKPKARNPRTGETIFVPPRLKSHFKPSKRLRNFLRQSIQQGQPSDETPPTDASIQRGVASSRDNSSSSNQPENGTRSE
jgi:integration host factor subunit beta